MSENPGDSGVGLALEDQAGLVTTGADELGLTYDKNYPSLSPEKRLACLKKSRILLCTMLGLFIPLTALSIHIVSLIPPHSRLYFYLLFNLPIGMAYGVTYERYRSIIEKILNLKSDQEGQAALDVASSDQLGEEGIVSSAGIQNS